MNHNTLLAIDADCKEYILMGKGIGFGKKVSEYLEETKDCTIYALQELGERGNERKLVREIPPECLEIANSIMEAAEKEFGTLDKKIIVPMADHISFALQRMHDDEEIRNPFTEDIKLLYYKEYKVASKAKEFAVFNEDEIGYLALHVHTAVEADTISATMQTVASVRECVSMIENYTGKTIDVCSISYNRLMNHIKYMVARIMRKEQLTLNLNEYLQAKCPDAFDMAKAICEHMENILQVKIDEVEIGYLAMHMERVMQNVDA